jgi:hypothetical protein
LLRVLLLDRTLTMKSFPTLLRVGVFLFVHVGLVLGVLAFP